MSPKQQCQSTKENSKHRPRPEKITHSSHPFFIHLRTPEGRGGAVIQTDRNTSSAVAQMGDCLATIDMGRKLGAVSPFFGGSWVPI